MPNELKDLIIPQPYTEQLNFYNELLREIYLSSYGLVSAMQLREYVLSQRTVRWRIHKDIEKLKKQFDNLMGSSSIPLDGNAINVKKYTADDLSNLTSKDCRRVENAAEVVQSLSRKVQLSVKSLTDHKISLFGETGTVKLWKSTELKFIDTKLDILKSITETIDGTLCKLAATSKVLKRKFFKADVDKQEEKRAEKRKKDNALKDRRDKELRMLKSCCQVLQLIAPSVMSDKVEDVFVKGKFEDIKVTVNDIVDDPALKPRFYLNALQYLKEKGIFDNSAIVKVDSFLKSLKIKKKDTMTKNEARKEKSELKLQSEKSQPTLFTLGFNRSKK